MSISRVGVGVQEASGTANVTAAFPVSYTPTAGHVAICWVAGKGLTSGTQPAAPSGWTARTQHERLVGSRYLQGVSFWRVITGGDSAPTFTIPSDWDSNAAGGISAQMEVFSGVDNSTPFDTSDVVSDTSATSSWQPDGITTVTDGAVVVSAVMSGDDNALSLGTANGFSAATGDGTGYLTNAGGDHSVGLADITKASAGAQTCPTWATASGNETIIGVTFALRPASAGSSGSGSPTSTLSSSASGTATNTPDSSGSTGSGSPSSTLSSSASGTATQTFPGSGSPSATLSSSASGTATQTFTGSGSPSSTLSSSASGTATQTNPEAGSANGSGAPISTLVSTASGSGAQEQDIVTGSGAVTDILGKSASGTATQTFTGSGAPSSTLVSQLTGTVTVSVFEGPVHIGTTGPLVSTGDRQIAWPGSNEDPELALLEAGDVALLIIGTKNQPVSTITSLPGATGDTSTFTAIPDATTGIGTAGNSSAVRIEQYWCRATSHDMAPVTISDPGAVVLAVMLTFRECIATGNPYDVASNANVSPAETNVRFQELTTTVDNCLIVGANVNTIDLDSTDQGSGYVNTEVEMVELIDQTFSTSSGIGLVVIAGEQLEAGFVGDTVGTYATSTRSSTGTVALKPPTPPAGGTGTGTPSSTLSSSASGTATSTPVGATGSPISTLVSTASGTATTLADHTGSGTPISTLSSSASGTATSTGVSFIDGSGAAVSTLRSEAAGLAYSTTAPDFPTKTPGPAGGQARRHTYYVVPDDAKPKRRKRRRKRRAPRPTVEAVELPPLPPAPAPVERYTFDPRLWQSLSIPVRPEVPIVPQSVIDEEEAFLAHILEVL